MKVHKNIKIMMGFRLILLIMNIGLIINIDGKIMITELCTDVFCKPEESIENFQKWNFEKDKDRLYIELFEETNLPTNIAIINCKDCDDKSIPKIGTFTIGDINYLNIIVNLISEKHYELQITNRQDYENDKQREYFFDIIIPNENKIGIKLDIIDIDDVKPSIIPVDIPCTIEENTMDPSDCIFNVEDPDSTTVTYEVQNYSDTFELINDGDSNSTAKAVKKIARLHLKKELDFETQPIYSFNIVATDDNGNSDSTLVIIKVKDVSDMPPAWMTIFATKTFKEHEKNLVYNVFAKDGDIEVNAPIKYKFDKEGCHKNIIVTDEGEIQIGDIDRDTPEIEDNDNTIKCTIIAYEDDIIGNSAETNSEIIFIVQDINDNIPEITLHKSDICMNEGEIIQFDNIFSVNDIDQGGNAQYDVKIVDDGKYSKAFQIIPSSGYREWDFSLTVIDAKLLDYDDKDWRDFELKIHATDKGTTVLEDEKTINVCLYNMNNNEPKFVTSEFEVHKPENVPANEMIINILAIDKDTDDFVSYEITMGQDKFELFECDKCDNDSVNIYTKKDNVFDYEKQKEVFFQITIHDNLNSTQGIMHKVSQQVTIIVDDINDEKPRITLSLTTTPEIQEHSENSKIPDILEAEDVDTTAKLEFSILWEDTYGMKEGKKITNKDLFVNVFKIVPTYDSFENGTTNYGKATASLIVADKNKLDWEEFETLYLKIQVEDLNQKENKPGIDVATMAIIILDINDSPPVLDPISEKFLVIEGAEANNIIGSVSATDKDGPGNNEIIYELTPIDDTKAGLIKINATSGVIQVDENKKIDADCPPTWNLNYTVTAKDPKIEKFKDSKPLFIAIDDTNSKYPRLVKELKPVYFEEDKISEKNIPIITVVATDDDRDDPYNVLIYEINGESNTELIDYFDIDENGNVFVKKKLLWTKQKQSVKVDILIKDNKGLAGYKDLNAQFILNIEDIDNNKPVLPENVNFISITEAEEKETSFAKIIATDADKPCTDATIIEYKISKIVNIDNDIEIEEEIFRIDTNHENEENDCIYYGNVFTNKNLAGYYGNFRMSVTATNPGSKNKDERDYDLKITPFNFHEPNITNPLNEKIILRTEQKIDETLILIDNNILKDFTATDNQGEKFSMTFSLETIQGEDIFNFKQTTKSAAKLQLKKLPETEEIIYKINVKASHTGTGNSKNEVEKTYDIYFIDVNQSPFFEKNYTLNIEENNASYCGNFPKSLDPKCSTSIREEDCIYKTYYHIFYKTEFFYIPDSLEPIICVKQQLDYETETLYELTIVATNNDMPPQGDPKNALTLTINVIDVNDEAPVFDTDTYLGGMSSGLTINTEIIRVHATDVDTMDQVLRYEIVNDSVNVSDSSLDIVKKNPFIIESKTGLIRNNFSPVIDMKGYLLFKVIVFDSGDTHNDTADVKIHIITNKNKISFTFNNNVELVKDKSLEVSQVFTNELEYNCAIDGINKKVESGVVIDNQTEVITHFINPDNNEPVSETEISIKTGDIEVISRLSLRFDDIGLELDGIIKKDVDQEIENMENLLRTLLIVVSVVLGSLIVILIIAFVLRTRSLNKRLESMTTNIFGSTKSDLNRIGNTAPGTNKHAVEANPVWNTNLNDGPQFDSISQTSGGSDLIGIEDNPEFQYSNKRGDFKNEMYPDNKLNTDFENDDDDINSLPGSNI